MNTTSFDHPLHNWDPLLTTKEAAKLLCVSNAFLERDRWAGARNGSGALVPFVKVGDRAVRYLLSDLTAHIERNRTSSNDD